MPLTPIRARHTAAGLLFPLLGAALCALIAVVGFAGPAAAHAVQTDSSPAEGRVVQSAPKEVTVSFSEDVSMSDGSLRVLGPDGKRLDTDKVRLVPEKPNTRAVGIKSGAPKGTYTVAWKAVSADSHPIGGAFTFSVGHPSATSASVADAAQATGDGPATWLYHVGRYAAYAGFVLLVGGGVFVLVCRPEAGAARRVQRVVVGGWLTLTGATLLMLLLRNAYTGTGELSEVLDVGAIGDVLGSKPGAALAARLLLLGTAAVIVAVLFGSYAKEPAAGAGDGDGTGDGTGDGDGTGETGGSAEDESAEDESAEEQSRNLTLGVALGGGVVAIGLAATWAFAEHASAGLQPEIAMPVDVVHLLAVAAWLGGLAALLSVLRGGPAPERAVVQRFSQLALSSVAVLAATGLYQSWRQVGTLSALVGTSYGRLLLAKIGLVIVLIGLASASRQWTSRLGAVRTEGADETAGTATGTAEETEDAGSADSTGSSETADEKVPAAVGAASSGDEGAAGSARAAQLARQRAVLDRERERKARAADPERSALRRSVLAEAAVATVLLVVTTALASTEPGRTEELAAANKAGTGTGQKQVGFAIQQKFPFDTGGPNGKGTAVLLMTPGQAGGNSLRIMTEGPDGKQLPTEEVKAALYLPEQDLGPFKVEFERINGAKGRWRSDTVQLPVGGRWKVEVTVRTSDIDQVTESKTVKLR